MCSFLSLMCGIAFNPDFMSQYFASSFTVLIILVRMFSRCRSLQLVLFLQMHANFFEWQIVSIFSLVNVVGVNGKIVCNVCCSQAFVLH